MSSAIYAALGRQDGLTKELASVANNLANTSTTGYKADRAVFAEYIVPAGPNRPSVSMGTLAGHSYDLSQSGLEMTGGPLDVALQGDGFFAIQTGQGTRLTRAGHFQLSPDSTLIDPFGNPVLGNGGGPITIPEDQGIVSIGADGTISAGGVIVDQIGVVIPNGELLRDGETRFSAPGGFAQAEDAVMIQGALEQSNVSPVIEVARMIEVQRAYEAGQALLEREDKRVSQLINAVRER